MSNMAKCLTEDYNRNKQIRLIKDLINAYYELGYARGIIRFSRGEIDWDTLNNANKNISAYSDDVQSAIAAIQEFFEIYLF